MPYLCRHLQIDSFNSNSVKNLIVNGIEFEIDEDYAAFHAVWSSRRYSRFGRVGIIAYTCRVAEWED